MEFAQEIDKNIITTASNPKLQTLRDESMKLPLLPGIYIMKDAKKKVIYVGKAKALKSRVSQYFGSEHNHLERVKKMVSLVDEFDYIVTDSEFEALVLECSLIKQHNPKYNILLKDDKGYHYVRVSKPPFPRITIARQMQNDDAEYIGPYINSFTVTEAVDEVNKIFMLPTCNKTFERGKRERPCLNFHIKQCCAPCSGKISDKEYAERYKGAVEFLKLGSDKILQEMKKQMEVAAENLEFEKAAKLRDRVKAINRLSQKQKVVMSRVPEQDVFAFVRGNDIVAVEIFRFSKGRLYDREDFLIDEIDELSVMRAEFLSTYYSMRDTVPPQVTIDGDVDDLELLEKMFSEKTNRKVKILIPQRGEQAQLVEMCRNNGAERLAKYSGIMGRDASALDELAKLLGLAEPPVFIESFDISHTAGSDSVGGMVVFKNAKPFKEGYRRFLIKEAGSSDDYGAMVEVVTRRFNEYFASKSEGKVNGFAQLPDLILLDGGKGQVSAVKPVLQSMSLDIPVYGMVKDDNHRTRAIAKDGGEIAINSKRTAFSLVTSIQDEVHRFSIAYHRVRRKKSGIGTVLTEIDGVGQTKAKALLVHFKSIKAIKEAEVEDIAKVKGFSQSLAQNVYDYFISKE